MAGYPAQPYQKYPILILCLSIYLSKCDLSISLFIYLSFCFYIYLSFFTKLEFKSDLSVYLSTYISFFNKLEFKYELSVSLYQSVYLYIYIYLYQSVYLFSVSSCLSTFSASSMPVLLCWVSVPRRSHWSQIF